ncbi:hypothetical protein [Actinoplanes sp. NPDC023714]|uniref:hypothetical protein n=1 Tax=Actinoplanes sp. NPDC023714 TaxID=3154322 RepID=UPI003403E5B0
MRDRPGRPPTGPDGYTDPLWEAATGATLARLLVAADARPVIARDGTEVFSKALDTLLTAVHDEQPALLRGRPARPDREVFRRTLARLIEAEDSYLQAIHTRTAQWPMIRPF